MNTSIKKCFVICPIGPPDSDVRRRADQVLNHLIIPSALECGYETVRADRIDKPGMITNQVLEQIVEAEIVIADLTDLNPNVMYELAIRHATRRPIIHIAEKGTKLPFDIQQSRTITVDHHDLDSAFKCRESILQQIKTLEKDPNNSDNPIAIAFDLMALQNSDKPADRSLGDVLESLQDIRATLASLGRNGLLADAGSRANSSTSHQALIELLRIRDSFSEDLLTNEQIAYIDSFLQQHRITQTTSNLYDEIWREVRETLDERLSSTFPRLVNSNGSDESFDDVPF